MDEASRQHGSASAEMAIDPVCEMTVDPRTARSAEYDGKTYYFCSEGCRTKFLADPAKYLDRKPFVLPPRQPVTVPGRAHLDHPHQHGGHEQAASSPQQREDGRRPDEGASPRAPSP